MSSKCLGARKPTYRAGQRETKLHPSEEVATACRTNAISMPAADAKVRYRYNSGSAITPA